MKKLLLIVLFFSACRYESSNVSSKQIKFDKIIIDSGHVFNKDEMSIIRNVCFLLKNKREQFDQYDDMKKLFYFHSKYANCEGKVEMDKDIKVAVSNINSTDMEYVTNESNYIKEIITDQSPGLKYLCDNQNGSNLSNTQTDGSQSISLQVDIVNNYYVVNLIKSKKDSTGSFSPKRAESISFISNIFQGTKFQLGIEKNYERYTNCSNGKTSYNAQTFINDAL